MCRAPSILVFAIVLFAIVLAAILPRPVAAHGGGGFARGGGGFARGGGGPAVRGFFRPGRLDGGWLHRRGIGNPAVAGTIVPSFGEGPIVPPFSVPIVPPFTAAPPVATVEVWHDEGSHWQRVPAGPPAQVWHRGSDGEWHQQPAGGE